MALFFDSEWFDARLAAAGLTREAIAAALGLDAVQLAELWKDQRELSADNVRILAMLLAATPEEIADRAGISTPVPKPAPADALAPFAERLDRIERALSAIHALLVDMKKSAP
ncbi:MAG: helix-turn-helix transcriptional regulator [Proteobacteria bacterium]|nr:helix-turn-helix transcriptional regulator [Pseudomonadota bacterium]